MDNAALSFLLTAHGQRLLQEMGETAITPQSHLSLASRLRSEVSPEQAHALLEIALLRQKAVDKFERAASMYFTREALEQASAQPVSEHRARRFAQMGAQHIADLACSIGGDALALSAAAWVVGVDIDHVRLRMARHNLAAYGRLPRFQPLQADLRQLPPLHVDAFFCDPGRRDEQGRRYSAPADYDPPLPALLERWLPHVPSAAVKVSPGIDYAHIPPQGEVEFVSLHGDVKEAVLWFGALKSGVERRATLLPSGATLTSDDEPAHPTPVTAPAAYLYEPDGAVIRAHLVQALAAQLGASQIDETIAYLTADRAIDTPFARCFAIDDALPFQLKQLRRRLRQLGIGRVTVKKRGSPIDPQELQRRLRLDGDKEAIVFLTHVQGQPYALIGHELPSTPGDSSAVASE